MLGEIDPIAWTKKATKLIEILLNCFEVAKVTLTHSVDSPGNSLPCVRVQRIEPI